MAEWLVEEGIGEHRAALFEAGEIVAARIDWPGGLVAGQVEDAVLIARTAGANRGSARFANGELALVDGLPREASEGAALRLEVRRAANAERSRSKFALARPTERPPCPAPSLAQRLGARIVRHFDGWDEVWSEATSGTIEFAGGRLTVEPTAAMTVIDIDGDLQPFALALAAVPAVARAIRRFDLSGSIAIDFPTLAARHERKAIDAALDDALGDWPHERTAMNGFGLVHLVARLEGPSLIDRIMRRWPDATARLLLRRAERVSEPGKLMLIGPSRVRAAFHPEWEAELVRRTGRSVVWRTDDTLAPYAAFAQAVPS
ncbi:ribonuclease E/G [Novosphingobium sp. Gsoil 351]|uniref:ribonuclease E/G n=1 Tax=Novosphingobium sp. Gsoil 351 TaxID=2675225 RepID=UPI0012B44BFF|nr:ribonuclease E/G [Novosphingobium sp. Gsoil 351]QGN53247.1 ribonuclease [Novosphingobium sp. Gsoil 351]